MTTTSESDRHLLRRVRWLVALFIVGLVLSGATAIPIETELNWLVKLTGARSLVESRGPAASIASLTAGQANG